MDQADTKLNTLTEKKTRQNKMRKHDLSETDLLEESKEDIRSSVQYQLA